MNQDKSFLLQKQVRDNSEDLRKELLELKNWEQEMKRKEEELLNSGEEIKVLPPIRSKKKKIIETSGPVPSTSKASAPDRIKSYDYNSWDQFDVDAACRKLEDEDESDEETEDVVDSAQKKHSEALKFKEQGNTFVQKKLYDSAINSYSEAIKLFPYDEVFYANRALCHLKQDNLYSAEADCTAALQLNDSYVKAYHRRATARIELDDYDGAAKDINRVLSLEPANKEAKLMLSKINKRLEKSQPLVITELSSDDGSVEKKIGAKICNSSKLKEQIKIHKQQMHEIQKLKEAKETTKLTITEISSESEQELIEEKLPDWLPKLDENYGIVKPIELSAHQRSKEPMKRITIKKVNFGNNILAKSCVENNSKDNEKLTVVEKKENTVKKEQITVMKAPPNILKKLIQEKEQDKIKEPATPKIIEIIEKSPKKTKGNVEKIPRESDKKIKKRPMIEIISSEEVPLIPKTAVQFLMDWKKNKSLQFRYSYLKQIPPEMMPALFKDSMESNVFEDIIIVLKEEFITKERNIFQYLEALSNIKRFRTLIMFIDRKTKEALKELFAHCRKEEDKSEQEIDNLGQKYEL